MDKHCNKITLNSPSLQNLFRYNQSVDGQTERQGDDKNNLKSQFKVKLINIRNFVEWKDKTNKNRV